MPTPTFDPDDLIPDNDSDDAAGNHVSAAGIAQVAAAAYPPISSFSTLNPFNPFARQTLTPPPATISSTAPDGTAITMTRVGFQWDHANTQQFVAYKNGNQVVIAIEGTDSLSNLMTDIGVWGSTGIPSPQFITDLKEAAAFIAIIQKQQLALDPTAQFSITGHSLGGAEAQILGYYLNLPAVGLNAPGVGAIYNAPAVVNAVGSLNTDPTYDRVNSPNPVNENIFIGNDFIHSAGTPFGTQGEITSTDPASAANAHSVLHWLDNHSIDTVESALKELTKAGTKTTVIDVTGKANADLNVPVHVGVPSVQADGSLNYQFTVAPSDFTVIDPPAGAQFIYTVGAGSPPLSTLYLPDDGQALSAFNVYTEVNGVWSAATKYAIGTQISLNPATQAFAFEALDSKGAVTTLPAGYLFMLSYSGSGTASGTVTSQPVAPVTANVAGWFINLLREGLSGSPDAALGVQLLNATLNGSETPAQALQTVLTQAQNTTSVATMAYEFFTGSAPSAGGMDFLISPTGPNPNNLNSAYYQTFNIQNRYINFAVNLGKFGAGAASFAANYGGLDLAGATSLAYHTLFGTTPSADKVSQILGATVSSGGITQTRAQYFAGYGADGANGIGTKAAMVGWLMAQAVTSDLGLFAKANDAFLMDIAVNSAAYGVDFLAKYESLQGLYPALGSAALSIADALAMPSTLLAGLTAGLQVADTSANVMANLAALQTLLSKGGLASITLTDTVLPTFSLTAAQATADLPVIADIVGAYASGTFNLAISGAVGANIASQIAGGLTSHLQQALTVSDSAANVLPALDSLEGLAKASKLSSIALTDASIPTWKFGVAQLSGDIDVLAKIASKFAVSVADYSFNLSGLTIPGMGTAGSKIDAIDMDLATATATWVENAAGTGGLLTVKDHFFDTLAVTLTGIAMAPNASLSGTAAGFVLASDGSFGTLITHH